MFKPKQYDDGQLVTLLCASGVTITKYDALDFSSGYVQRATDATTQVKFVAMEDVTAATEGDEILCLSTKGVRFVADCTTATTQATMGTCVDLTDHLTIDEDAASTDYVFEMESIQGAVADKKIVGYFHQAVSA